MNCAVIHVGINILERLADSKETGYGNIFNLYNTRTITHYTAMGKHYREKHGDIPIPEQPFNVITLQLNAVVKTMLNDKFGNQFSSKEKIRC